MTRNVLVTSAGRRVSLVRGFQSVCAGSDRRVLTADAEPELSAACHVSDATHRLPLVQDPSYPQQLLSLCKRESVGLVVPTIDTELPVLSDLRSAFKSQGIEVVVSDAELIAACADKRETHRLFADRGMACPKIYDSPGQASYPAFAKPWDGSLSRGTAVVRDRVAAARAIEADERTILCAYLDPKIHDEFTIDCYFDRASTLRCAVPRQRLEVRAGEVAKAICVRNELDQELFEKLAQLDGARGALTVQAFVHRTNRTTTWIEINARFGGGYPLTRHAGADFQRLLLAEYLEGLPVPAHVEWRDRTRMLRYDDEIVQFDV